MTDILVTGLYGQLGRAVARIAEERGLSVVGDDVDTLDITDPAAVTARLDQIHPRAVVNCAAYTAVDRCEDEEELATAVNGTAVGHLATACNRVNAHLLHVSTDYVFPGTGSHPYSEDDPVGPVSAYGRSKLRGEELATTAERHLIARTAWLYGRGGKNFVETIRQQIEGGRTTLKVVADQTGCPTFCDDLARALLDLARQGATGVVHAVNSGATTWHGFACEITRLMGSEVEIEPVSTDEFPRPAPRPAFSVLDTSRLASILGRPLPPWEDGLARYLDAPCGS
jgi:dTDP-4-dehydrorhamnose reductase